jgi:ketosteroid isomerase-like protein
MLRFLLLTGCAGLLLVATGCAPKDTSEADAATLKTTNDAWSKDVAAKDPAKFAQYYADDATLMLQNEPIIKGLANIKSALGPMMQDPSFALSFSTDKVEVSGTLGYAQGPYSLTTTARDGKPFTDKGKYLTVFRKQADGSWKAIEDILNSDAPPDVK